MEEETRDSDSALESAVEYVEETLGVNVADDVNSLDIGPGQGRK